MFSLFSYQDYEAATDKSKFIKQAIDSYRGSDYYRKIQESDNYFLGENTEILTRKNNTIEFKNGKTLKVSKPVMSNIFKQLIIQQNSTILSNGLQIKSEDGEKDLKPEFGKGFDRILSDLGENALKHGVSYGYWNYDKLSVFTALEMFTLDDERSNVPMAAVRFWDKKTDGGNKTITFIEFYQPDGATEYKISDNEIEKGEQRNYGVKIRPVTNDIETVLKYPRLPIIPFYANPERTSELTRPIKTKIDFLDELWTNFRDSASRINMIYWIISNFSVTEEEAYEMIEQITRLGIAAAKNEYSAEPKAFDLPTMSVKEAIDMTERAITADFMGVSMREIMGGSLTNVAINTAFSNLMKKVVRFGWEIFDFVQNLMSLLGIPISENIKFKLEIPQNVKEYSDMVINAADYLDLQTIIENLPFIEVDEQKNVFERAKKEKGTEEVKKSDETFPFENEENGGDAGG